METRTYNGFTYQRNAAGEPWTLVGPAATSPAMTVSGPIGRVQRENRQEVRADKADIRADVGQAFDARRVAVTEAGLGIDRERVALTQQQAARDQRNDQASQQRNATNDRASRADKLRSDYEGLPSVKTYTAALPVFGAGLRSGDDAAGDLNLIYAYAKVMDPGSVVREGEQASVASGDTWINQKSAELQKQLGQGGTFKPEFRKRLRQEMAGRMGELNQLYIADRVRYKSIADRNGVDVRDVVGDHPGGRYQALSEQVLGRKQQQLDYNGMPISGANSGGGNTGGQGGPSGGGPAAGGSYKSDPSGTRTFLTERDKAFTAEAQAAFQRGASRDQINAIATKYGAQPFGADLDRAIQARSRGVKNISFAPTATGREEAGLIGGIVAPYADSNLGAYAIGAGNAVTFGQLGNIAELTGSSEGGTKVAFDMARRNTVPYVLGEITGSIAPTMGIARGMSAAGQLVSNPVARALVTNPVTSDALYGAAYGAGTAENSWKGGIVGGGLAAGGSFAGGSIGRGIASILARSSGAMNAGQRAVMAAVDRTGRDTVVDALNRAESVGAPATLADVSPEVGSLTGAAIRRSPTVAGQARDTLIPRGRGQYDRFVSAVERDLGPVQNIPQRSEELIQQARTDAGPLYDTAYAAPGAGAVHSQIEGLLNRPSMRGALARARSIAAEEGRDPSSLGFTLDGEGNTVLLQVPSWQTLDYAKRGMDDVLDGYRDKTTGRLHLDEQGQAIDATRRQFLRTVDRVNPDYAAARAAYAGPATERDALRMGQGAATLSPDQLAVNVANATPTQVDQMRLGFQSQLAENAGKLRYSTNPFESVLGTPAMEQRLGTLYPQGGSNIERLLTHGEVERQMATSSNRLVGNSMTAERQAADQAFEGADWLGPAAEVGANVLLGQVPIGTAIRAGLSQRAKDAITLGLGSRATATAEQIGPITLIPDPARTVAQILSLDQQRLIDRAAAGVVKDQGQRSGHKLGSSVAAALVPYASAER